MIGMRKIFVPCLQSNPAFKRDVLKRAPFLRWATERSPLSVVLSKRIRVNQNLAQAAFFILRGLMGATLV